MRNYLKSLWPYAILLLILLIAYLPLSTFYFGMKNDAFSDNFPNKFFLSQAVHAGKLPLWNPYINYGFPVYADMGFAFYNPITWLFALVGYNAYTLTLEVLLYVYLSGVFMFRLGLFFGFGNKISITIAAMYMCSGFYAGCLQYINFLTAAAFLPLATLAMLQLFTHPSLKHSFIFAIAACFIFAGGHPAIPIGLLYFLLLLVLLLFYLNPGNRANAKKIGIYLFVAAILFTIFCLPALYSYANILPFYYRSTKAQQAIYSQAGFTFYAYISFLLPYSTITNSNIFNTDVAMRNGFFSVAGFICAVLAVKSKQAYVRIFVITGLCMLLLSAGGMFKTIIFANLPLLGYVRYNGEYRVFSIFCFCVAAGFGVLQLKNGDQAFTQLFKIGLLIAAGACASLMIALMVTQYGKATSITTVLTKPGAFQQKIKFFLSGPFSWFLMISAAATLMVSTCSFLALQHKKLNVLLAIIIMDVAINCAIYLPVTGVGQVTLKTIQGVYNTSPKGMPVPALIAVNAIDTFDAKTTGLVGDATYYNKLIGTTKLADYPSFFTSTLQYFNNKPLVSQVSKNAYLFVKGGGSFNAHISVQQFSPTLIQFQVSGANAGDTLVLLQNNYRYWHAVVNGQQTPINAAFTTFMSVKISKGDNTVVFYYQDRWLGFWVLFSLAAFITCLSVVARQNFIYKLPKQNQ